MKVKCKWNKQLLDLTIEPASETPAKLKDQLYQLSGVPVERQKIMAKGVWKGVLKDDMVITNAPWKEGMTIVMMGTSTGIPKPPEEKTQFLEDMSANDQLKVGKVLPPGLNNLGNTCYLNSTIQCMKVIPELREYLNVAPANSSDLTSNFTTSLKNLYQQMDHQLEPVTPMAFVSTVRSVFPQFAQLSNGHYAQQDSDEFLNSLLSVLSQKLTQDKPELRFGDKQNAVDALFGIDLSTELKCAESDAEPIKKGTETQKRLQCEIEKNSEVLGRNALWKETKRIKRLPKYLIIQFNRFYWKRTPDSRDHEGVNCKIMKPVKFPFILDVFELCDEELKKVLKVGRDKYAEDAMEGKDIKKIDDEEKKDEYKMEIDTGTEADPELAAALAMSMEDDAPKEVSAIPKNFRGNYELFGVVTHKGRASNSGHYMGWIKSDEGKDDWVCFDDDHASECKEENVGSLSGGGDWHMAYMVFYRMKD